MGIVRSKLNENPDGIRSGNNLLANWMGSDAVPFGFYDGELFLNLGGGTHGGIPEWSKLEDKLCSKENKYCKSKEFMEDSGRLWQQKKLITFWKYPIKTRFKEIIDTIGKAIDQPNMFNDPEWKVEVITGKREPDRKDDRKHDWSEHEYFIDLIPLSKYVGSNERSKEELAQQHIASPMDKLKRPDKTEFFKVRDKKTKPLAWKQAMQAESLITENPDGYKDPKSKENVGWMNGELEPVVFGWYDGKLLWDDELVNSEHSKTHGALGLGQGLKKRPKPLSKKVASDITRSHYDFPGRLWRKTKVISFWRYPTAEEMPIKLKELGKAIGEEFFDNGWTINTKEESGGGGYFEHFVSVDEYIGSARVSSTELARDHAVSPMLKKPISSGPGKMHAKTPKPLAWRQAMYAESVKENLNESPDMIEADNLYDVTGKYDLGFYQNGAIPFGYYNNKMRVGKTDKAHRHIHDMYDDIQDRIQRRDFTFGGRAWPFEKIISFWNYPKPGEFQKVLKDIEEENKKVPGNSHIDFNDPNWSIEIISELTPDEAIGGPGGEGQWKNALSAKLIPFSEYTGSTSQSKEDQAKQHTDSPMNKLKRPKSSAYFKVGDSKEKPLAWKQALVKSESLVRPRINESPDNFTYDGKNWDIDSNGALAFEVVKDDDNNLIDVKINPEEGYHGDFKQTTIGQDRIYPGRIYSKPKIITFWVYPNLEEFKEIINLMGKSLHEDLWNKGWKVEVYYDPALINSKKTPIQPGKKAYGNNYNKNSPDKEFVPIENYMGSLIAPPEEKQKHLMSYKEKLSNKKSTGWGRGMGSDKYAKEKPLKFRQALQTSESLTLYEKLLVGEPVTIEELRDVLNNKVLNFEFIKLDGEVRPAKGTTMMKYIPKEEHPTGDHPSSDKVAAFYDLSKDAWRSVSNRSSEIVLIQGEDGKIKVQISDKVAKEPKETKPEISKVPGADPRPILPKSEPVVRPSLKPDEIPVTPDIDDIEVDTDPDTPLDIEDKNIMADDVKDKDIIAPETEEPEVDLPEPQETPPVPPETPMEPAVKPELKQDTPEDELPPEEDITFPDDEEEAEV
jgi:hypothetical protein